MSRVTTKSRRLDATFAALADPTRRSILARLGKGAATVGELADPFDMSLPAISKHIKVLESAGLISRTRSGRNYHCRLRGDSMKEAAEWIAAYRDFWDRNLRALDEYLQENYGPARTASKKKSPRTKKKKR